MVREEKQAGMTIKVEVSFPPFSKRVGIVAFLLALSLILLFIFWPDQRENLKFVAPVVLAAAAITSAFYVGESVRQNSDALKMTRTLAYAARWNDPHLFDIKNSVADLVGSLSKQSVPLTLQSIQNELAKDPLRVHKLRSVLNLLEEIAGFINMGILDEEVLREFYHTIVVRYYEMLGPWIEDSRQQRGKRLYRDLEALYNKWKSKS